MKRKLLCFFLLIALGIADITAEDRMSYYLFSYFTDNSTH